MDKLFFLYRKGMKFPISTAIIFNQDKKGIAEAQEWSIVYCYGTKYVYKKYNILIDFKLKQNPKKIFNINLTFSNLFFAEKDGKVEVLLFVKDKLKILSIKNFVENHWNEQFTKEILDIHYK